VNVYQVLVWKNYFNQAQRIAGSGFLAKLVGEIATGVFRPIDCILVDRFYGAIDDFDIEVFLNNWGRAKVSY